MEKYILITGCFDIVHLGHLKLFEFAKEYFPGRKLVVALDTDKRVSELKGDDRPYNTLESRMEFLKHIKEIDFIKHFGNDLQLELMCQQYNKPIRIVGSDRADKPIIGIKNCSCVVYFNRYGNYSTTNILENIK